MPAKTDRRHRQGDESRGAILDATLQIAAERGYDGTTVALVTQATGLPASSIYWHFKNKDELLAATLEHSYQQWRAAAPTWAPAAEPAALEDRLTTRFQKAAGVFATSPQFWSLGLLLTLQHRVKEPAARKLYRKVREDTEEAVRDWWAAQLRADAIDADPALPTRLARFYMMMMDGLFLHAQSTSARDAKRLVSLLAAGMAGHLSSLEVAS